MTTFLVNARPVLEGWANSSALGMLKINEDAALQGHNAIVATISQFAQSFLLLDPISKLLPALRWPTKLVICLTPFCAYFAERTVKNDAMKAKVLWLHRHIGTCIQIASLVANMALFHLGMRGYGAISLCTLAFDFALRRKWVPAKVRQIYLKISPIVSNITLLYTGDWLLKAFAATELGNLAVTKFLNRKVIPYDQVTHASSLRMQDFRAIMHGTLHVVTNREHILIAPFPQVKTKEYGAITRVFESLNWDEAELNEQLENDPRWAESEERQSGDKKGYVKRMLQTLIYSIEYECIETGEPLNYSVLKNYLGYIAEKLPLASKDVQRTLLLQLAIEGGNYCGPGIYSQLESAAMLLLTGQKGRRLPLKQRILLILQQERLKVVSAFHLLIGKINLAVNNLSGGDGDVHAMNSTINTIAYDFGLPDQGAKYDLTASIMYLERLERQWLIGIKPKHLWQGVRYGGEHYRGYTEKRIVKAVMDQIGISWLPHPDIIQWARGWIKNVEAADKEKDEFIEQLQDGTSFERHLKFNNRFIIAMLVDMNILKV